jgi:hypothetical protein
MGCVCIRHRWGLTAATVLLTALAGAMSADAAASRDGLPPGTPIPAWAAGKVIHFDPAVPAGARGSPNAGRFATAASPIAPAVKASASTLDYGGGPVQNRPHVVVVFWGTGWEQEPGLGVKRELETMYDGLAGSNWQRILTQYRGATGAISETPIVETYDDKRVAAPTGVEYWKIHDEAEEVAVADSTAADPDVTYIVLPAPGTAYAQEFDTGFCGWHSPLGGTRAFAFIPYEGQAPFEHGCAGFGGSEEVAIETSKAASHEYAESVTDPDDQTGWSGTRGEEEIADLCNRYGAHRMADGAWVAELWDDAKNACESEDAAPAAVEIGPYLDWAEETESEVAHTSATLAGSLAPCGLEAHYYFEYGASSVSEMRTPVGVAPAGIWEYVTARAKIEGLLPETEYRWRLVVETSDGIATGREHWFISTPYVALFADEAEDLGTTEAKLYGDVNPEGEAATYYFEYGATEAYGSRTTEADAGSGAEETRVSAPIGGLAPSAVYHFRIVAKDGHGTFFSGDRAFVTGGATFVETAPATEVGATGAMLHAAVGPHHGPVQYGFEYGTTEAYGSRTPGRQEELTVSVPFETNEALAGLAPDTVYHYRIFATDSYGTSYGSDQTFTTKIAPSAHTDEATAIGETGATLTGAIDPNGADATYHFEYRAGNASPTSTAVQAAGSGTDSLRENATVTGLAPGTTYHYRLVASNEFAVVEGEEKTFTTASAPHREPEGAGETTAPTEPPASTETTPPTAIVQAPVPPLAPAPLQIASAPAFTALRLPATQHGYALAVRLTVAAAGSAIEVVAAFDRSARRGAGGPRATVVLGRVVRAAAPAGRLRLTVALNARGRRELRRAPRLALMVKVVVRPPAGAPRTAARTVTLMR